MNQALRDSLLPSPVPPKPSLPCEAFTDEQLIDLECMVEEIVRRGIKPALDSD